MWSRMRVLSAILGFGVLVILPGAIAAAHFDPPSAQAASPPLQHRQILLADWNDHHVRWHHHYNPNSSFNPNDYNWGGRYRYEYPPHWFSSPPPSWAMSQRRAYLEQRREVAINMRQQMLARGDMNAAQRLGGVIGQLDRELGYR